MVVGAAVRQTRLEKARAIFGADAATFAAQARTFASFPVALAQGVDEFHATARLP